MLRLLRFVLIGLCVTIGTIALGTHFGIIDAKHPARARPGIGPAPLAGVARPATAPPARLVETTRSHLTESPADIDAGYAPDPRQGTRHVTTRGFVWWGSGPTDGAPRPVILLLNGAGRDGQSMIDMWHETAQAAGAILVAPDFASLPESPVGLYDPGAALDALEHAAALHPVDRDKIVLFGHSRGGIAA